MRRLRYLVSAFFLLAAALLAWRWFLGWREHRYDRQIAAAASRYGMDPALIKAIVWRESRFHPNRRGGAGELGLMQIRELAAAEWAAAEHIDGFDHAACLDPATNILAATWYFRQALRRYRAVDNPAPYALADYNAGRGNVIKWCGGAAATNSAAFMAQIAFPGTRAYIRAILQRRARYEADFAPAR